VADLKTLRDSVSKTVKSDYLKSVITSTITELLKEHKVEIRELLDEKNRKLEEIIETQTCEIEHMKT
jgi:hypothetical protein